MATEYSTRERKRQSQWRTTSADLPLSAHTPGAWRGRAHGWILPIDLADLTLWAPIRAPLLAHFEANDIAWHGGEDADYGARATPGPSPNLMDSQVACLNFWWGLAQASPAALLAVVRNFAPDAAKMVSPVEGGPLVEPEWIGLDNPLKERGARRRGQYATSADLLIAWEDHAGVRHGALIESKYSESYTSRDDRLSSRGTDRSVIYAEAAAQPWSTVSDRVPASELIYEPFYQHLRQQLLAAGMEDAHELGLQTVALVHVAPRGNRDFHETITAPALRGMGASVATVWRAMLTRPERYTSVAYEDLFATALQVPAASAWADSLRDRYGWAE